MKFLDKLFSRIVIFGILLILQVFMLFFVVVKFSEVTNQIYGLFLIVSIIAVAYVNTRNINPAYKLGWAIVIMAFPMFGIMLYFFVGNKKPARKLIKKLNRSQVFTQRMLNQDTSIIEEIINDDPYGAGNIMYIENYGPYPIYKNTKTNFFKLGEEAFEDMLIEIKKAKKYIFIEYFIVHEGKMWNSILDILEQKVKEGVDVRFIYDDIGSVTVLPAKYKRILEKKGIKTIAFNPFVPFLSMVMNNRDHRKIMVIDGKVGYTGGINLSDEYINEIERFGHWKDNAIKLEGEAVWSFTMMFLEMWNGLRPTDNELEYEKFKPDYSFAKEYENEGYVQPYSDSPLDNEILSENIYINILNAAKDYVYIYTPYLIIDNEMTTALILAAKRGVDVRIVIPGIPDKKSAFELTKSFCPELIENGVKVYHYTPGFIHGKCFLSDDKVATVGTANMDYRSLYLHFECGVYLYKTNSIKEIKKDMLQTFEVSTKRYNKKTKLPFLFRLYRSLLRLFAPLM